MGAGSGFDDLARGLASGDISRRSALKRLAAGAIGIGAVTAPAGVAEAFGGGCPSGRVKCKGKCCPANARCKNGKCKCKPGFKKCGGRKCIELSSSPKHCGACGNPCASGEVCVEGVCLTQECTPGETQACYTGPAGTAGIGICHAGTKTCNAQGTGYGTCVGEVTPGTEICDNGQDDDCDGVVDNGCVVDQCQGVDTDDGLTCTTDTCDPATGEVSHTLNPNTCLINGQCYTAGESCNGSGGTCQPGTSTTTCNCVPQNAAACQGRQCGSVTNNCGEQVNCGNCSAPNTCTGQGQCVCVPQSDAVTCGSQGRVCGGAINNCGQLVNCGICPSGTCNASGQCVPAPRRRR